MTQAHPSKAQRRLLTAGGGIVVVALAGGAFVLTFDTLRALAVHGGVSSHYAYLYPGMLDGLVVVVILSILMSRRFRWWSRAVRWLLLLVLVAGAGAAGAEHAVRGYDRLPRTWVSGGVAVAPWVILLLAFWLWVSMIKQARRMRPEEPRPALEAATDTGLIPGLEEPRPLPPPPVLPELAPAREEHDTLPLTHEGHEPDEPTRKTPDEPVRETADGPMPDEPAWRTAEPVREDPDEPVRDAAEEPVPEEPALVARTLLPTDVPLVGTPNDTRPDGIKLPDTRPDGIPIFESAEDDDTPDRAEDPDVMPEENAEPPSGKVRSSPTPPRD